MRLPFALPLLLLHLAATAQLPNDDCAGALPIACGLSAVGNTATATTDTAPTCGTSITAPGVWFSASGLLGTVTITTCPDTEYDTKLNVYQGGCLDLQCVGGNDDTPGLGLCSTVVFDADPDATYLILVQGYNGATGEFQLSVNCSLCPEPSGLAVNPFPTGGIVQWTSANTGAGFTVEFGPEGFAPGEGTSITGTVGSGAPPLLIDGLDTGSAYDVYLTESCTLGDSDPVGPVTFTTGPGNVAANALCAGAVAIACGGTANGNTTQGLQALAPTCGSANITTKGLWYSFTGDGGTATLSTCGATTFDSKISVFAGGCTALACVAGNDDAPGCAGNSSELSFATNAGTVYLVLVHGYANAQGSFTLSLTCAPACTPEVENDDCPDATVLLISPVGGCESTTGTNVCAYAPATPNPDCDPFDPIVDVWYAFDSGDGSNHTLLLTMGTSPYMTVGLYGTCGGPILLCEDMEDGELPLGALAPNTTYLLRLWNGGGTQAGTFTLCLEADQSTGTTNWARHSSALLHPNPTHGPLTITGVQAGSTLHMLDLSGRQVMELTAPANTATLDTRALAPGTYMVRDGREGRMLGRFVRE
jgi:hypothetical protein